MLFSNILLSNVLLIHLVLISVTYPKSSRQSIKISLNNTVLIPVSILVSSIHHPSHPVKLVVLSPSVPNLLWI